MGVGRMVAIGSALVVASGLCGCNETTDDGGAGPGSAGSGSCTDEPIGAFDTSHCAVPPFQSSSCGEEGTRAALRCGEPGTLLDEDCCLRPVCEGDADCAAEERCIPRMNQAHDAFGGSLIEGCEMVCDSCSCSVTDDVDRKAYCVPADRVEAYDCNVTARTCDELLEWDGNLDDDVVLAGSSPLGWVGQRMDECRAKVGRELAARCELACTCRSADTCSLPTAGFCPFEAVLGCPVTFERAQVPAGLCENDVTSALYSECIDGTVQLDFEVGGENEYGFVFDPRSANLYAALASGYVGGLCALEGDATYVIRAGSQRRASACESCEFCGDFDPETPACVFDAEGRVALPP